MPIYEYECPKCGILEILHSVSDTSLKNCPQCEERGDTEPLTKVMSASSFHLKGSGWYKTDYTKSGESKAPAKNGSTVKADANGSGGDKPSSTSVDSASSGATAAPSMKSEASTATKAKD